MDLKQNTLKSQASFIRFAFINVEQNLKNYIHIKLGGKGGIGGQVFYRGDLI